VRADLAERQAQTPLDEVKAKALTQPSAQDGVRALRGEGVAVIAEVKRSSPSKGALAAIADPAALAGDYEQGGASVISVLTERHRFGGSLQDLKEVRARVDIPVLRKDFVITSYQLWEARAHGADLVLLIVSVAGAGRPGVPDRAGRVDRPDPAGRGARRGGGRPRGGRGRPASVGVNARNLRTLEVDRGTFARLAR